MSGGGGGGTIRGRKGVEREATSAIIFRSVERESRVHQHSSSPARPLLRQPEPKDPKSPEKRMKFDASRTPSDPHLGTSLSSSFFLPSIAYPPLIEATHTRTQKHESQNRQTLPLKPYISLQPASQHSDKRRSPAIVRGRAVAGCPARQRQFVTHTHTCTYHVCSLQPSPFNMRE